MWCDRHPARRTYGVRLQISAFHIARLATQESTRGLGIFQSQSLCSQLAVIRIATLTIVWKGFGRYSGAIESMIPGN